MFRSAQINDFFSLVQFAQEIVADTKLAPVRYFRKGRIQVFHLESRVIVDGFPRDGSQEQKEICTFEQLNFLTVPVFRGGAFVLTMGSRAFTQRTPHRLEGTWGAGQ